MLRKIPLVVAVVAALMLFFGCGTAPTPKTYEVTAVRVIGTTTYVEMRVSGAERKVVYTCDITQEKPCAFLKKGDLLSTIVSDGKLTAVKMKKP